MNVDGGIVDGGCKEEVLSDGVVIGEERVNSLNFPTLVENFRHYFFIAPNSSYTRN